MCTPQIRSAIAPPRSTSVRVVFILRAPCRTQSAYPLISSRQGDQHTAIRPQKGALHSPVNQFADETGKFLFETSLAEHSNRNNGAPSTKERDERNCPDGVTEQCRSDPRTHRHNEHNCGRNNGNNGSWRTVERRRAAMAWAPASK